MKTKEDLQAMSHGELVEYALEAQNNIIIACDYQRKMHKAGGDPFRHRHRI